MHYFCTNYLTQYPCTALVPIPGKPQYHRSTTKGQGNHLCGWTHEHRAAFSLSLSLSLLNQIYSEAWLSIPTCTLGESNISVESSSRCCRLGESWYSVTTELICAAPQPNGKWPSRFSKCVSTYVRMYVCMYVRNFQLTYVLLIMWHSTSQSDTQNFCANLYIYVRMQVCYKHKINSCFFFLYSYRSCCSLYSIFIQGIGTLRRQLNIYTTDRKEDYIISILLTTWHSNCE